MKSSTMLANVLVAAPFLFASTAAAQTTLTVQLVGVEFVQRDVTIQVGDTIHWEWVSGFHNVESGTIVSSAGVADGNFRSGDATSVVGTTFDLLFDQAFLDANPMSGNVYPYYCIVHTGLDMAGTITVLVVGDVDGDADVDLDDHATLVECMTGPNDSTPAGECLAGEFDLADMDGDGDVDLWDAASFQRAFTG